MVIQLLWAESMKCLQPLTVVSPSKFSPNESASESFCKVSEQERERERERAALEKMKMNTDIPTLTKPKCYPVIDRNPPFTKVVAHSDTPLPTFCHHH